MGSILTCARGHRWSPEGESSGGVEHAGSCPFCGETGTVLPSAPEMADAVTVPKLPLVGQVRETATLPAPSREEATIDDPGAPVAPSSSAVAGPVVEGYEILGLLGRGGMGVVYKARDVALNRVVALKMLKAGSHAGESERARFRTEAEAIARLQHPNVVQIYEVGEADGCPYLSLEFCGGGTLAAKLARRPLPPLQAARLASSLGLALHYCHQRGILHRDLKPANVLLTTPPASAGEDCWGEPKITDFGLAKQLEGETAGTQTGALLGTPGYMAPEQAGGRVREVGPWTDVYQLGATLYQLVTGRPPFEGDNAADVVLQVLHEDPIPPSRSLGSRF